MRRPRSVGAIILLLVSVCVPQLTSARPVDAAAAVVAIAQTKLGNPFRMGREGPQIFDCSGLVYYVYQRLGLYEERFGTRRFLAREYYRWGRERGRLSRTNPQVGDLALWTDPRTKRIVHMGIYTGSDSEGRPEFISALTVGVRRHSLNGISVRFLTYVHTNVRGTTAGIPDEDKKPTDGRINDQGPRNDHGPRSDNGPRPGPAGNGVASYKHVGRMLNVGRNIILDPNRPGPVLAR